MNIKPMFIYTATGLKRQGIKTLIHISVYALSFILLLSAWSFTVFTHHYIDMSFNRLDGELIYRQFDLVDHSSNSLPEKIRHANELVNNTHIEKVDILDESKDLTMIVTVDDYKNTEKVMLVLEQVSGYEIGIQDQIIININLIQVVKSISLLILLVVIILTLSTVLVSTIKTVEDRQQEIALFKALGYNKNHLFCLIFMECFMNLIISFTLAAILSSLFLRLISSFIISQTVISNITTDNISLDFISLSAGFIVALIFALLSTLEAIRRTTPISPFMLLKI